MVAAQRNGVRPFMPTLVNSDAHLARLLQVDRAVVSRDKRRGMPTDSLEAARAWREKNLSSAMRKDSNPARDWARSKPGTPAATRAALVELERLVPVAVAALASQRFDLVKAELQAAMRAVPPAARASVSIPTELWDALVGWLIDAAKGGDEPAAKVDQAAHASTEPSAWFGDFLYGVAAGEPVQWPS